MISIKELNVSYKSKNKIIRAIENFSLDINSGEICTIIGPSGCGKSTLLKVVAGIIKEYEGQVTIDKMKLNTKIHRIGYIPQNYGLINWKTVEDNILLGAKIKDGKNNIDREHYRDIIKELRIEEVVNRYPRELSGGQMQRVAMARALVIKPNVLLMDECFSALDEIAKEEIQKLFLKIWKEYKVTTILVTHNIKEAIYLGEKIAVMRTCPESLIMVKKNEFFEKEDVDMDINYFQFKNTLKNMLKERCNYEN